MQATALRKKLYGTLSRVAQKREAVEVLRHGRPLAVIVPSPALATKGAGGKPSLSLNAISEFCQRHRLSGFYLFGSIVTDQFRPDSDVDVMIDTDGREGLTFSETCRMLDELEGIFGRKVDMLTKSSVTAMTNIHVRDSILKTSALIYRHV